MKPQARRKARFFAIQAIYQWQLTAANVLDIKQQFLAKFNPKKVEVEYFYDLLDGVIKNVEMIDKIAISFLDRSIKELDPVELAVLRMAIYELKNRLDVPYKVIINEALELTKNLGSIEGYKYVNGILDKVARSLRSTELH